MGRYDHYRRFKDSYFKRIKCIKDILDRVSTKYDFFKSISRSIVFATILFLGLDEWIKIL